MFKTNVVIWPLTCHPHFVCIFSSPSVKAYVAKKRQPYYFQLQFQVLSLQPNWCGNYCQLVDYPVTFNLPYHKTFYSQCSCKVNCTSMSTTKVKRSPKSHHLNETLWLSSISSNPTRKSNLPWQINKDINGKSGKDKLTKKRPRKLVNLMSCCGISWGTWCNVYTLTVYVFSVLILALNFEWSFQAN